MGFRHTHTRAQFIKDRNTQRAEYLHVTQIQIKALINIICVTGETGVAKAPLQKQRREQKSRCLLVGTGESLKASLMTEVPEPLIPLVGSLENVFQGQL